MGSQQVGQRWLNYLTTVIGEPVIVGITSGHYEIWFTTADHQHGVGTFRRISRKGRALMTLSFPVEPPYHFASCNDLFGENSPTDDDVLRGCGCTELCSMGPTCPGGILARLPGSGCEMDE